MGAKRKTGKKSTIFRMFLLPLIGIMLMQSAITIGTLVVRRTTKTLEEYSSSMMSRLVENRGVVLSLHKKTHPHTLPSIFPTQLSVIICNCHYEKKMLKYLKK